MGADADNAVMSILHTEFPRYFCRDSGRPIARWNVTAVVVAVAAHDGARMTLKQLSWLTGISYSVVIYAVVVLLDAGLIERIEPRRGSAHLPTRWRGKAYAYTVNWGRVLSLPRKDLTPRKSGRTPRAQTESAA